MALKKLALSLSWSVLLGCTNAPKTIAPGMYRYSTFTKFAAQSVCGGCPDSRDETDEFLVVVGKDGIPRISAQGLKDAALKTSGDTLVATGSPRTLLSTNRSTDSCREAIRGSFAITRVGEVIEGAIGREEGRMCQSDSFVYECSCIHSFTAKLIRHI